MRKLQYIKEKLIVWKKETFGRLNEKKSGIWEEIKDLDKKKKMMGSFRWICKIGRKTFSLVWKNYFNTRKFIEVKKQNASGSRKAMGTPNVAPRTCFMHLVGSSMHN